MKEPLDPRPATENDLDDICTIADENSIKQTEANMSKREKSEFIEKGFLVSGLTRDHYEEKIDPKKHFYVLEDWDEDKKANIVVGFLLAIEAEDLDEYLVVNRQIKEHSQNPYILVKQICVRRGYEGRGYATRLYEYLIRHTECDIYAAVVIDKDLRNNRSVYFHRKMGFEESFETRAEDGKKRGLFKYRHPKNIIHCSEEKEPFNTSVVVDQYDAAINLYMHEDNLNWTKLNSFVVITGGLLAVDGLLSSINITICVIISFLGFASALLFSFAIRYGVAYLQDRKERVVNLERILARNSGMPVVTSSFENKRLRRSPTTKTMIALPIVFMVVWALLFCAFSLLLLNDVFAWGIAIPL